MSTTFCMCAHGAYVHTMDGCGIEDCGCTKFRPHQETDRRTVAAAREEALAQGFADSESLIVTMLSGMAAREDAKAQRAEAAMVDALDDSAKFEAAAAALVLSRNRAGCLREVMLVVSVGQHRTDAYDQDAITTAHQQAATAGLRRRGGRNRAAALSPERRREIAVTASNAARAARERAKGEEMTPERKQLILDKLEVFNKLERRATDEVGWIALQFSVTRKAASKMIDQAKKGE